ncbi:hypothetical protein O9992_30205 [Vibrio lentus]|nr:hypothetical protein [Vibrio lentus]
MVGGALGFVGITLSLVQYITCQRWQVWREQDPQADGAMNSVLGCAYGPKLSARQAGQSPMGMDLIPRLRG